MKGNIVTKTLGVTVLAAFVAGCAGLATASPEARVMQTLEAWEAGVIAEDIDALMLAYSDDFEHYEYGTKSTLEMYFGDLMAQGMFSGAAVSMADMEVEIDGGTATAYPIDLEAAFGGATIEFVLQEQASGEWLITSMDVELY